MMGRKAKESLCGRADGKWDVGNVGTVLKITTIRVKSHLEAAANRRDDAKGCFANGNTCRPAAPGLCGRIKIGDELCFGT